MSEEQAMSDNPAAAIRRCGMTVLGDTHAEVCIADLNHDGDHDFVTVDRDNAAVPPVFDQPASAS